MQPMIIQNNQLFPVNIPMLYGMNQGFNVETLLLLDWQYPSIQGMPMMQQNMVYPDAGMGYLMPNVQNNSGMQGLPVQQVPGVQNPQNMANIPIQQLSGMPMIDGNPSNAGNAYPTSTWCCYDAKCIHKHNYAAIQSIGVY